MLTIVQRPLRFFLQLFRVFDSLCLVEFSFLDCQGGKPCYVFRPTRLPNRLFLIYVQVPTAAYCSPHANCNAYNAYCQVGVVDKIRKSNKINVNELCVADSIILHVRNNQRVEVYKHNRQRDRQLTSRKNGEKNCKLKYTNLKGKYLSGIGVRT